MFHSSFSITALLPSPVTPTQTNMYQMLLVLFGIVAVMLLLSVVISCIRPFRRGGTAAVAVCL